MIKETGDPLHGAHILVVELGRSTLSADDGSYELNRLPPGRYQVIAHLDSVFNEEAQSIDVTAEETVTVNFMLSLSAQRYEISVTASEKQETPFESFSNVNSLHAYDLGGSHNVSLGEVFGRDRHVGGADRLDRIESGQRLHGSGREVRPDGPVPWHTVDDRAAQRLDACQD